MNCETVAREMVSLLYGELDAETEKGVRDHLETCARCREEFERHRETIARLDAWQDVDLDREPLRIDGGGLRAKAALADRGRPAWIRAAAWAALAAGLLLAVAAGFLGLEVRRIEGGIRLTLGGSGESPAPSHAAAASIDETRLVELLEPAIRGAVLEEMERRFEGVLRAVVDEMTDLARDQESKRAILARAVYLQREEDLRRTREMLRQVTFETAARSVETRRMLEGIVALVRTEDETIEPKRR